MRTIAGVGLILGAAALLWVTATPGQSDAG